MLYIIGLVSSWPEIVCFIEKMTCAKFGHASFSNFFVEEYVRKFFDFKSHGLDIKCFCLLFSRINNVLYRLLSLFYFARI